MIERDELACLKEFAVETVSQFEMCFPSAFFDVIVHLVVHLVSQIEALGPCICMRCGRMNVSCQY